MPRAARETALTDGRFSRRSSARGGQAPALRVDRDCPLYRRARACPSPCNDRNEKRPWPIFAQIERARGTGPRATIKKRAAYRRARACPSPCNDLPKQCLAAQLVLDMPERVAGEGPRATVDEAAARLIRSGSGEPELQFSAPNLANLVKRDYQENLIVLTGVTL